MAKPKEMFYTINARVLTDKLNKRGRGHFEAILRRDWKLIIVFLGIIWDNRRNPNIVERDSNNRLSKIAKDCKAQLDLLTLRTKKGNAKTKKRLTVKYDVMTKYPNISPTEWQEIRDSSVAMFDSYLALKKEDPNTKFYLQKSHKDRKRWIPRDMNITRKVKDPKSATIDLKNKVIILRNSLRTQMDANRRGLKRAPKHDKLLIPLELTHYQLNFFKKHDVRTLSFTRDRIDNDEFWVHFHFKLNLPKKLSVEDIVDGIKKSKIKPIILVPMDLGITLTACTVEILDGRVRNNKTWKAPDLRKLIIDVDNRISKLQSKRDKLKNENKPTDDVKKALKEAYKKRYKLSLQYDGLIVKKFMDYIKKLEKDYTVLIAVGKLKGIKHKVRKGITPKYFRVIMHRWSYFQFTNLLERRLTELGIGEHRIAKLDEWYTSIKCWKCEVIGRRPDQHTFICVNPKCKTRLNADVNGATNIGKRAIMYFSADDYFELAPEEDWGIKGWGRILPYPDSG